MSHAADFHRNDIVGINWGSSNFRAYRIAADGQLVDQFSRPAGVSGLSKEGMLAQTDAVVQRWADVDTIYACGMIGSNIGWCTVPYVGAPASIADVARATVQAEMGQALVSIVPGISCSREFDGGPDILRGEEIELFGFAALHPGWHGLVALPGTHTKWVRFEAGRIRDFFTSMSGEIFDRLTAGGLLASIIDGEAEDGPAFHDGVRMGHEGKLGLATLLFGARARVMQGRLERKNAASYLRGLLIGSEIADALAIHPGLGAAPVPLIGNGPLCRLYASALSSVNVESLLTDSQNACIHGFLALNSATQA